MNFEELHKLVPYARHGKPKSLSMTPYNGVTLLLPGRHAEDTNPKGGDFCVCVSDSDINWTMRQFTHGDIFKDIQTKHDDDAALCTSFVEAYFNVVTRGIDPNKYNFSRSSVPGLHRQTFLYAIQCLAVAEHRRYQSFESKGGGRFLPLRFVIGIADGLWTADEAAKVQKYGRPAVERLEKERGRPVLTSQLLEEIKSV